MENQPLNIKEPRDITISYFKNSSKKAQTLTDGECKEALGEIVDHFQQILDCLYDYVFVMDSDGTIVMVNKAVMQTDFHRENIIGTNIAELVRQRYSRKSLFEKVLESNKPEGYIFLEEEGHEVLSWGVPHLDGKDLKFVAVTEWDIENLIQMRKRLSDNNPSHLRTSAFIYSGKEEDEIITASPLMHETLKIAGRFARSDSNILIQGESGTGKELIMKYIYNNGPRTGGPLVKVNCGAIPENLLESELFGYEKGSFTDSGNKSKAGYFEMANHGTLFLDEVAELPLTAQTKLLRVLQEKEIHPVGASASKPVDVHVIAATNYDLKKAVEKKAFRQDLYFRLQTLPLQIPPLRNRKEDIPILAKHFAKVTNKKYNRECQIASKDLDLFLNYLWPGNVRELQNIIERAFLITPQNLIPRHLWVSLLNISTLNIPSDSELSLKEIMDEYEKKILLSMLPKYENSRQFAELLGTDKSTINRKFAKHGIKPNFGANSG
ncbi:MAG: sigma 54-interacting transcriptional regulator [Clostridiaceae bacterium]|nr:sigma 54-interacting transcriptional regulator [Clostridiaceae bacterium]